MNDLRVDAKQALAELDQLQQTARAVGQWRRTFSSDEEYFWPIETGTYLGGGVARVEGGAHMFETAMAEEFNTVLSSLPESTRSGQSATIFALDAWALRILERTRALTPVLSGRLRAGLRILRF
jgi:hypothetical protein